MVVNALNQHNPAKAFGAAMRKAERQSHHGQMVENARLHDLSGRRYPISVAPERIVARQSDVCAVSKLGDCCIVSRHGHELHIYLPKVPVIGWPNRARHSRNAPKNTPKCLSAAASPAPRRSCSICSMPIISYKHDLVFIGSPKPSRQKSAQPPKPACSTSSWANSISPTCRKTSCCARSGCSANR